jgi:hypothetical protein
VTKSDGYEYDALSEDQEKQYREYMKQYGHVFVVRGTAIMPPYVIDPTLVTEVRSSEFVLAQGELARKKRITEAVESIAQTLNTITGTNLIIGPDE